MDVDAAGLKEVLSDLREHIIDSTGVDNIGQLHREAVAECVRTFKDLPQFSKYQFVKELKQLLHGTIEHPVNEFIARVPEEKIEQNSEILQSLTDVICGTVEFDMMKQAVVGNVVKIGLSSGKKVRRKSRVDGLDCEVISLEDLVAASENIERLCIQLSSCGDDKRLSLFSEIVSNSLSDISFSSLWPRISRNVTTCIESSNDEIAFAGIQFYAKAFSDSPVDGRLTIFLSFLEMFPDFLASENVKRRAYSVLIVLLSEMGKHFSFVSNEDVKKVVNETLFLLDRGLPDYAVDNIDSSELLWQYPLFSVFYVSERNVEWVRIWSEKEVVMSTISESEVGNLFTKHCLDVLRALELHASDTKRKCINAFLLTMAKATLTLLGAFFDELSPQAILVFEVVGAVLRLEWNFHECTEEAYGALWGLESACLEICEANAEYLSEHSDIFKSIIMGFAKSYDSWRQADNMFFSLLNSDILGSIARSAANGLLSRIHNGFVPDNCGWIRTFCAILSRICCDEVALTTLEGRKTLSAFSILTRCALMIDSADIKICFSTFRKASVHWSDETRDLLKEEIEDVWCSVSESLAIWNNLVEDMSESESMLIIDSVLRRVSALNSFDCFSMETSYRLSSLSSLPNGSNILLRLLLQKRPKYSIAEDMSSALVGYEAAQERHSHGIFQFQNIVERAMCIIGGCMGIGNVKELLLAFLDQIHQDSERLKYRMLELFSFNLDNALMVKDILPTCDPQILSEDTIWCRQLQYMCSVRGGPSESPNFDFEAAINSLESLQSGDVGSDEIDLFKTTFSNDPDSFRMSENFESMLRSLIDSRKTEEEVQLWKEYLAVPFAGMRTGKVSRMLLQMRSGDENLAHRDSEHNEKFGVNISNAFDIMFRYASKFGMTIDEASLRSVIDAGVTNWWCAGLLLMLCSMVGSSSSSGRKVVASSAVDIGKRIVKDDELRFWVIRGDVSSRRVVYLVEKMCFFESPSLYFAFRRGGISISRIVEWWISQSLLNVFDLRDIVSLFLLTLRYGHSILATSITFFLQLHEEEIVRFVSTGKPLLKFFVRKKFSHTLNVVSSFDTLFSLATRYDTYN